MSIGHSFKIQILCYNSSFTSICSLPGFSADGLQPPMRSDGGLFGADRRFKCADDSMLTPKALDWEFQKGVYHFCAPKIDRVIVWHLMLHSAIDVWPWPSPCTVNVVREPSLLLHWGAFVNAWPDFHALCLRWLLITLIFTFFSGANLTLLLQFNSKLVCRYSQIFRFEDWLPKIFKI